MELINKNTLNKMIADGKSSEEITTLANKEIKEAFLQEDKMRKAEELMRQAFELMGKDITRLKIVTDESPYLDFFKKFGI